MFQQALADLLPHLIAAGDAGVAAGGQGPHASAVRDALAVMRQSFDEPISLAAIAAQIHVSPSHLARIFRRQTGRTVTEYLHALRISHAKQLLAETDDTVLAVALSSGFGTPEHFHRVFRKRTGTTPAAYRALHKR
jgi:AraC family transcriptional regulator